MLVISPEVDSTIDRCSDAGSFSLSLLDDAERLMRDLEPAIDVLPPFLKFEDVPAISSASAPALDGHHSDNIDFFVLENAIGACHLQLESCTIRKTDEERRKTLIAIAEDLSKRLERRKIRIFEHQQARDKQAAKISRWYNMGEAIYARDYNISFLVVGPVGDRCTAIRDLSIFMVCFVVVVLWLSSGLSRRASTGLLEGLSILATCGVVAASHALGARSRVPRDIRTALRMLDLNPIITAYPVCSNRECCKVFFPFATSDDDDDVDGEDNAALRPVPYPDRCDNNVEGEICNEVIMERYTVSGPDGSTKTLRRPRRTYVTQSIEDWIAELLKRDDFEVQVDGYMSKVMNEMRPFLARPASHHQAEPPTSSDIWYSRFIHNLASIWPDGHSGFGSDDKHSLRLMFSLGIDWFNPFGNRIAGKSHSVGAIYLICNNLPPGVRILQGNTCLVGIIPGRRKPKGEAVGWFLKPIVRSLHRFWHGVHYSATFCFPDGRDVFAILGPVVCDLDAARSVGGMPSHRADCLCSVCDKRRSDIGDIELQPSTRKLEEHLSLAHKCRELSKASERIRFTLTHGVGWSELLRLQYWNPIWLLVVDPMHNLFLGLCQRHFRIVLGMDYYLSGWGDFQALETSAESLCFAQFLLASNDATKTRLQGFATLETLRELVKLCPGLNNSVATGTKAEISSRLIEWASHLVFTGLAIDLHTSLQKETRSQTGRNLFNESENSWRRIQKSGETWLLGHPHLFDKATSSMLKSLLQTYYLGDSSAPSGKQHVIAALIEHGVRPDRVRSLITESHLVEHIGRAAGALKFYCDHHCVD